MRGRRSPPPVPVSPWRDTTRQRTGGSSWNGSHFREIRRKSTIPALASCAPGPNPLVQHHAPGAAPLAGFFLGIWHGAIVWVTFFVSLFSPGVSVYEVHNTGWPYNLGFVLGTGFFHGGGGGGASAWRRRRERRDDVS